MESRQIRVNEGQSGQRLDRLVSESWPDHSRSFWKRHIESGRVRVNGRAEKSGYLVKAGQLVDAQFQEELPRSLAALSDGAEDWPDWVLYHDAAIIVINKPRHLVVHPSAGHWGDSVVHRLLPWLPRTDGELRPGVVHRLDRDTSGLMVLARSARAKEVLSHAIQERTVTRQYVAVVRGHLEPPDGRVEAPLGRDPANRLRMAVVHGGREARTRYRTLAMWAGYSLMDCTLDTGRTHQIRVHLAALGHPVVGDPVYGGRHPEFTAGQLLHAGRLSFRHPVTDEQMEFVAPPPPDWSALKAWGEPLVSSPWVYQPGRDPATVQWLSELGISPRSS